jgi:hypothetical protein
MPSFWRKPPGEQPRSPCSALLLQIGKAHCLNVSAFGVGQRLVMREINKAPQHGLRVGWINPVKNIAAASSELSNESATGHWGSPMFAWMHDVRVIPRDRSIKFVVNLRQTLHRSGRSAF